MAAVRLLKGRWHEGFDRVAGQLAAVVAEHVLQPRADHRDRAVAVCQRHCVLQRVQQLFRRDGRRPAAVRRSSWRLAGPPRPGRQDGYGGRQPGGHGCLQRRVDGHQPVQAAEAEDPRDDLRGDHQPQLRAADLGPLPGADHRVRAGVVTGDGRGHVRDQRGRAAVDDRQQFLPDLPGIRCPDVLRKRHHRQLVGPLHRVSILNHDGSAAAAGGSVEMERA